MLEPKPLPKGSTEKHEGQGCGEADRGAPRAQALPGAHPRWVGSLKGRGGLRSRGAGGKGGQRPRAIGHRSVALSFQGGLPSEGQFGA